MFLDAGAAYLDIIPRVIDGFGEKISQSVDPEVEKSGEKAGGLFKKSFAAAGVAGAAALGVGFSQSLDLEASQGKLSAQLGLTSETAKNAGQIAANLYKGAWGESIDGVNEAIKSVSQNITNVSTTNAGDFEKITSRALDLSTAFDQDLTMATASVGQMMKTGLAKNAEEAFDILTVGLQNGANKSDDLLETFNEYGTQFRQIGLDGKTAMGLLTQGLQAGARDADIVADSLKEFAIRAQDGSTTTAEGFKLIGLNATQMAAAVAKGGPSAAAALDTTLDKLRAIKDPAKQAQAAVALFGTQSEDLQDALYKLDPSTAVAALGAVDGAAQRASDNLNTNAKSKIESFKREALMGLTNFVGDKVLPGFEKLTGFVQNTLGPNFDKAKDVMVGAMAFVAASMAFYAASIVAGWVRMGIASAVNSAKMVAGWVASGAAAIAAGATHAYVVGLYVLDWIKAGLSATVNAAKVLAGWVVTGVGAIANVAIMGVQAALFVGFWVLMGVQSLLNAAKVAAAWFIALGPIGWVIAAVIALVALIIVNWDTVTRVTAELWHGIQVGAAAAWSWITGAVSTALNFVKDLFLNWSVPGLIIKHWSTIREATAAAWNFVTEKVSATIDFFAGIPGKIGQFARGMWDPIWESFKGAINLIIRAWNNLELKVPEIDTHIPGIGKVGGFSLGTPDLPMLAKGGTASGWFIAGEEGPELVHANSTSRVLSNADSIQGIAQAKGETHYHYNLGIETRDAKPLVEEFREMERLAVPLQTAGAR